MNEPKTREMLKGSSVGTTDSVLKYLITYFITETSFKIKDKC